MTKGLTVERPFRARRGRGDRRLTKAGEVKRDVRHRVPRVARLMALAIRFEQLIRDGVVTDQAELAWLGQVSRARLTQILNLLTLAPDIQEALLHLRSANNGSELITERHLRTVAAEHRWSEQRRILNAEKLGF